MDLVYFFYFNPRRLCVPQSNLIHCISSKTLLFFIARRFNGTLLITNFLRQHTTFILRIIDLNAPKNTNFPFTQLNFHWQLQRMVRGFVLFISLMTVQTFILIFDTKTLSLYTTVNFVSHYYFVWKTTVVNCVNLLYTYLLCFFYSVFFFVLFLSVVFG